MFQEQERNAYQSIRVPQELREKVMAKKKPKRQLPVYLTTAIAACLVLAIGMGFFFRGGEPNIRINGQTLESSVVYYDLSPASEMRSAPILSVPVELELSGESEISVSHGTLVREGQTPVSTLKASSAVSLIWQIQLGQEMTTCEMTITHEKGVTTMTLEYVDSKITVTKKGD